MENNFKHIQDNSPQEIGLGAMDATKAHEFIRLGAMDATTPYDVIWFLKGFIVHGGVVILCPGL